MRARNIKPGFYKNEDLVQCSFAARLLFPGLWMMADRCGRLEDRPLRIKMELFPADNVDVDSLLGELCAKGFLSRYIVEGKRFIQVENFIKHQTPHVKEPKSTIPAPDLHQTSTIPAPDLHNENTVPAPPDSLIPYSLIPEEKIETPNGVSARNRKSDPGSRPSARIKPNGSGWSGIGEPDMEIWSKAYPAVDIQLELSKAFAWVNANPTKTKRNYHRFLTNWMARSQERGGSCKTGSRSKANPSQTPQEYQPCPYRDISQDIDQEEAKAYEEKYNTWS